MKKAFSGPLAFLSNFHDCPTLPPTLEHHYQAAKTNDPFWRELILAAATPGRAKRLGRLAPQRPGWDDVKAQVMLNLLRQKFAPGSALAEQLLATGTMPLIEENTWGDTYWGVSFGRGENVLGKLLMLVRADLSVAPYLGKADNFSASR